MKQTLPIEKKVFERNSVSNVIDRNFNQFIINAETTNASTIQTVEQFFEIYEELFFDIPKEGETNSHQYLIAKSSEYLNIKNDNNIDIQLLQEEITSLRQQLLEANQTIRDLKIIGKTSV